MTLANPFFARETYSNVEFITKIRWTWITIRLTWLSRNAFAFDVAICSSAWWTMTIFLETMFQGNAKTSFSNTILSFIAIRIFRTFWDNAFVETADFFTFAFRMLQTFIDAIMSNVCITVLIIGAIFIAGTTRRSTLTTIFLEL